MAEDNAMNWHVSVFDEPEQLRTFLNQVHLLPEQIASLQFHPLGPSTQRILLACRLSPDQVEAADQWAAVERLLSGEPLSIPTGGH